MAEWTLESESRQGQSIWWSASIGWVTDRDRATRFASREDAEAFFRDCMEGVTRSAWAVDFQKSNESR